MGNLLTLIGYEYKKIGKRKGAVLALVAALLFAVISPPLILLGYNYLDGEPVEIVYQAMVKDREYARALAGQAVDTDLLLTAKEAYEKVPEEERGSLTPAYNQYARPYAEIHRLLSILCRYLDKDSIADLTAEEVEHYYQTRAEAIREEIEELHASEQTKEKLTAMSESVQTPWSFDFTEGWQRFWNVVPITGFFAAFALTVCLAPVFAGEYSTGASQLILSSRYGKNKVITAKLLTVFSLSTIYGLLLLMATLLVCGSVFGWDGAAAAIQVSVSHLHYPINMLETVMILAVCTQGAIFLTVAATAFLSSRFRSPFGVIIITCLLIFGPGFMQAPEQPLLFNLYRLMPGNMMSSSNIFALMPYEIFGQPVMAHHFLPVFSILAGVALLLASRSGFRNYQYG